MSMAFYYPLLLSCLTTLLILIEATKNGGITVDLIHRESLASPSYDPSSTHFERLRSSFHRSFARKSSLRLTSMRSTFSKSEDLESTLTANSGEYLMKIKIGTPPVEQLAIADTGSDLTWVQCQPCTDCYKQNSPLFDPSKTKTYRKVACDSSKCLAAGSADCDESDDCRYEVTYGDRSHTMGDLATDTFTFESSSNDTVSYPNVAFGCGYDNAGTFNANGSGIVGLGGGSISIINQLDTSIGGKFSYCLTLLNSTVPSKISFGSNAIVTGPKVVSTPLVKKSIDTFYYLTLEGVSIGKTRLEYTSNSDSNSKASFDKGNIIIDSGTTLTFIPSEFYDGLESALVKAIKGKRVSDSQGLFNLCYALPSDGGFESPPIVAHFEGGDLVLPLVNTFLEVEQGVVCLTIVRSEDMAIFGNLNPMNFLVGFDRVKQTVNFLPTDCSKSE